jgi:hypothetical protein
MNSHGMFLCQSEKLDEAGQMLSDAFHMLEADQTIADAQILDLLKATTLNNLGVVECHKGLHREALNHLEVAQALEQQWHVHSPSICLNLCATYNALGSFDKATKAALETITLLRDMAQAQRAAEGGAVSGDAGARAGSSSENPRKPSNPLLRTSSDENQVLWGAAWHNLGVAQINTALQAKKVDPADHTNVLVIFQNAIKATTDLLGAEHSMSKAVLLTYRAVRTYLRDRGVFKQHTALLTCGLPPVTTSTAFSSTSYPDPEPEPGQSLRSAKKQHQTDIRITIRPDKKASSSRADASSSTTSPNSQIVQLHTREAYPVSAAGSDSKVKSFVGTTSPRRRNELRGLPVSGLLVHATSLYANPHPLLLHGSSRQHMFVNTTKWESSMVLMSGAVMDLQMPPPSPRRLESSRQGSSRGGKTRSPPRRSGGGSSTRRSPGGGAIGSLVLSSKAGSNGYLPPIENSPRRQYKQGGGGGLQAMADPVAYSARDAQEVLHSSDMAMWVEAADSGGNALRPHATRAVRPAYAQQIYLVDDDERVAQPSYLAHKDIERPTGGQQSAPSPRPPSDRRIVAQDDHYPNLHMLAKVAQ